MPNRKFKTRKIFMLPAHNLIFEGGITYFVAHFCLIYFLTEWRQAKPSRAFPNVSVQDSKANVVEMRNNYSNFYRHFLQITKKIPGKGVVHK